jgi:hypothetical protein
VGIITERHARHAVAKLLHFDIVLDLGDRDAAKEQIMRLGMGWQATLSDLRARPSTGSPLGRMGLKPEEVLPLLRDLNTHDALLYRQAQLMYRVDGAWLAEVEQLVDGEQGSQEQLEQLEEQWAGEEADLLASMMSTQELAQLLAVRLWRPRACGYFGSWIQTPYAS